MVLTGRARGWYWNGIEYDLPGGPRTRSDCWRSSSVRAAASSSGTTAYGSELVPDLVALLGSEAAHLHGEDRIGRGPA